MRTFVQFSACCLLGMCIAALLLIGLMFVGRFDAIEMLLLSGKPLAQLSLILLPDTFWSALTGVSDAPANGAVQSFLQLCVATLQMALLLGVGFFQLWYRR